MKKVLFKSLVIGVLSSFTIPVNAQINPSDLDLREAFKKSYEAETALKFIKAIEEITPFADKHLYEVDIRLGYLNYLAAKFQQSEIHYKKCIEKSPKSIEARLGLVNTLAALEKWDEALNQYKEILKVDAGNAKALYNLSLIYFYRSDYTNAQVYLNSYLTLYPFDFDGINLAGWNKYYLGKKEEAYEYFKKAILLSPYSTMYDKVLNIK